jgi:hypothetical protein
MMQRKSMVSFQNRPYGLAFDDQNVQAQTPTYVLGWQHKKSFRSSVPQDLDKHARRRGVAENVPTRTLKEDDTA